MPIPDAVKRYGLNKVFGYLERDPRKNAPKIMEFVDKHIPANLVVTQRNFMRAVLNDPDNIWYQLIMSVFDEVDPHIVRQIFQNFVTNGTVIGWPQQQRERAEGDCNIPWLIAIDPTSSSNSPEGNQFAAPYCGDMNLSFDEIDSIIEQGKELGIYIYVYAGGEPLLRWRDLIALANKHNDCQFVCITNGTLVDDEVCREVRRVGNIVPLVTLEGFTDVDSLTRQDGPLASAHRAMETMRANALGFGTVCGYTSRNVETAGSGEFYDWVIGHHAKFCWFFAYMPVGDRPDPDLVVSPDQREWMYGRIRSLRKTKPLAVLDFSGDGEYLGGCVGGGRRYLHINANGDVCPCMFVHYSDSNIREKTLLESVKSPLIQEFRRHHPIHANMLRPCPVMDDPDLLAEMVQASGAHGTDAVDPAVAVNVCARCRQVASEWAPRADRLWEARCHNPALLVD